jgi:hypothetical protein
LTGGEVGDAEWVRGRGRRRGKEKSKREERSEE